MKKGGGYWLWKPYIINKTINLVKEGDFIFYCDSGSYVINDIHILTEFMKKNNLNILCFELPFLECQFTKKELFKIMDCDSDVYKKSNQILASYIIFKVTDFTKKFFKEYLFYATRPNSLIDSDYENELKCFLEHRNDQSIFSLLCKKYNIKPYRSISEPFGYNYNNSHFVFKGVEALKNCKKYTSSTYPRILIGYKTFNSLSVFHLIKFAFVNNDFYFALYLIIKSSKVFFNKETLRYILFYIKDRIL